MKQKSCFFIGHRDTSGNVMFQLQESVNKHIAEYGVTNFIVGNYGAFDRFAAKAVINAKKLFPNIVLSLLLPYHPAECLIKMPDGFDGTYYPSNMEKVPKRFAIYRANRNVINQVEFLIAYAPNPASNSIKLVEYAQSRERKNLITITLLKVC